MNAISHHKISKCYLKLFIENPKKPFLHVGDRSKKEFFPNNIQKISAENHFNTIETENGYSDILEQKYSILETAFTSAAKNTIENSRFCSEKDKSIILELIALFHVRNSRVREELTKFRERTARLLMEAHLSTPQLWQSHLNKMKKAGYLNDGLEIPYEKIKELAKQNQYYVPPPHQNELIEYEIKNQPIVWEILLERRWTILKAPANSGGFITCDHPVYLMWNDPADNHPLHPPGIAFLKTSLIFPLSKGIALLGSFEDTDETKEVSEFNVAIINGRMIANSYRQIYSKDLNFWYWLPDSVSPRKGIKLLEDERFQ